MIFRVQRKNADIYHQFYFLVKKKSLFEFQVKCVQYAFFRFFGFRSFVLLLIRATMNSARHQTAEYGHDR